MPYLKSNFGSKFIGGIAHYATNRGLHEYKHWLHLNWLHTKATEAVGLQWPQLREARRLFSFSSSKSGGFRSLLAYFYD